MAIDPLDALNGAIAPPTAPTNGTKKPQKENRQKQGHMAAVCDVH